MHIAISFNHRLYNGGESLAEKAKYRPLHPQDVANEVLLIRVAGLMADGFLLGSVVESGGGGEKWRITKPGKRAVS